MSNLEEKETQLQNAVLKISYFESQLQIMKQEVNQTKAEKQNLQNNLLESMKLQKDLSLSFKQSLRQQEEINVRESNNLKAVLKEKKCRDCMICVDDLKGLKGDQLVSSLNDQLVKKTVRINQLEEASRKTMKIISQISTE